MKQLLLTLFILSPLSLMAKDYVTKPDFSAIKDVKAKKQTFFDYLYPFINKQNLLIEKERSLLEAVLINDAPINEPVIALCQKYAKDCKNLDKNRIRSLLSRVDTIPPSLVLAQAANESAWGTSRFAIEANNFFGQWCFHKGCGLIPLRRTAGSQHEVRKFESVEHSVEAYLLNLNTNNAYKKLRTIRARARENKKQASSLSLAEGLIKYSERGSDYVKEIKSMIRFNKLIETYDKKTITQR